MNNDKIKSAKAMLGSYTSNQQRIKNLFIEQVRLDTLINKVASGSPKKLPETTAEIDNNWRSEYYDELEVIEAEILLLEAINNKVDTFLEKLDDKTRKMFEDKYISNKTFTKLSATYFSHKTTIIRLIDEMIAECW